MRHFCFAIAASAALLAAGASPDCAGAQGANPFPPDYQPPDYGLPAPGYEPLPYAFGSPPAYGHHPEYGQPSRGSGPPRQAYRPPPGYGPVPQYGPPPL